MYDTNVDKLLIFHQNKNVIFVFTFQLIHIGYILEIFVKTCYDKFSWVQPLLAVIGHFEKNCFKPLLAVKGHFKKVYF